MKKTKPPLCSRHNIPKMRKGVMRPSWRCEKCDRESTKRSQIAHPETFLIKLRRNAKTRRLRNQSIVDQHLLANPCVDCGVSNPLVLQFDHVLGTKTGNVGTLASRGCTLTRLTEEVAKCVVRCANCHQRRTSRKARLEGWVDPRSNLSS